MATKEREAIRPEPEDVTGHSALAQALVQKGTITELALAVLTLLCVPSIAFGQETVSDEALAAGHRGDASTWPMYGGTFDQQRFSPLDQVNRENVAQLEPAWVFHTGVYNIASGYQTTPVVHGGAMYVTTPRVGRAQYVTKLDARTGEEMWRAELDQGASTFCCGANNRGAAVYGDKVYVATIDATLYALNASDGTVAWSVAMGDGGEGYSQTCAPLVYDDLVVVGVAGGEYGIRGYVTAYDASTGEQRWRWYAVPSPEEGGWEGDWVETAPGLGLSLNRDIEREKADLEKYPDAWKTGGAPVWMTPSLDVESRTLYVTTGNPGPDYDGTVRPGDNLWAASVCALDFDTGELRWGFQYLPHDIWDYGGSRPAMLFDVEFDGESVPAVGFGTKMGFFYLLNRETGALLKVSENYVPIENLFAPLTEDGVRIAPGSAGGTNWSPTAYSPKTKWAYLANIHWPMVMTTRPGQPYRPGSSYQGGNASFSSTDAEETWGSVVALDPVTGTVQWEARTELPMFSGVLATAGGLVFAGQSQGSFDAWDAETGAHLWGHETQAGVNAAPATYLLDGTQYVVVAAGGSRYVRRDRSNPPQADGIIAFTLP